MRKGCGYSTIHTLLALSTADSGGNELPTVLNRFYGILIIHHHELPDVRCLLPSALPSSLKMVFSLRRHLPDPGEPSRRQQINRKHPSQASK